MENKIVKFFDNINCAIGAVFTALTQVFGVSWILFAGYLIFNVIDWITGWCKAVKNNEESSKKGLKGIVKKVGYWVLIAVAFIFSFLIVEIGVILEINLSFVLLFGWFTLACMIVNEVRSVLENLVALDVYVPHFLTKGLKVTSDLIDKAVDKIIPDEEEK